MLTLLRLATHNAHTKYQTGKWVVKKPFSSINSGPVPQFARYANYRLVSSLHSPGGGPLAAVVRDGAVYEGPHVALPSPRDVQGQHACTYTV